MRHRQLFHRKQTPLWLMVVILIIAAAQQAGWVSFDTSSDNNTSAATQATSSSQPGLYRVSRFVDGDTIVVNMNGKNESIRMIGVDTPETHKPNTPVQCYGPAASAYTKNIIGANKVRLQSDPKSTNRDRYERLLRYVYLSDGRLVEQELIRNGYGFAYTQFPFTKSDTFVQAQESAKIANKGLWGNCNPYQENNGRWQTNNAT